MDAFLELFGDWTVADIVKLIIAASVVYGVYRKLRTYFIAQYEKEKEKDKKLQKLLDQIEQYPKWRQQSVEIQQQFTKSINELKEEQRAHTKKLEEIEAENKKRERNKLREQLLQSHRYYTSTEKNPMQAWSEMEADAFWKSFGDYEDVDGNGHIHTVVQPAMRLLEVIPMHETEKITELMQSRK